MACAAIGTRWGTASCSARRVSSVARGARCVARARKARDAQTEEGGTNETRREEPPPLGDSSGFADSARAASHGTASSSSERDSARGAFGEYLSSVQATLDAWEGTDLRNPELAGVGGPTRATRRARANGSTSGVASFLVEISQTKLLTKEEEVLLATNVQQQARVVAARAAVAERLGKDPNDVAPAELARALGAASAADLETLRITANRSKQLLLRHNLRLVVSVAKKFIGRGVAFEDLIQEGIGGLIRGVEGFDPERGFKFSTYAHWWIRQSCSRAVNDQSRTIRLPVHVYDALSKLQKCRVAFELRHGRRPTRAELAALADMREDKVDALERAIVLEIHGALRNDMGAHFFYEDICAKAYGSARAPGPRLPRMMSVIDSHTLVPPTRPRSTSVGSQQRASPSDFWLSASSSSCRVPVLRALTCSISGFGVSTLGSIDGHLSRARRVLASLENGFETS